MLEHIYQKIQETLEGVDKIKEVFGYPIQGNPSKYPAVIYFPMGMEENSFSNTKENYKIFTFNLSVIVSLSGTTVKDVYTDILPKISDLLVETFDEGWDMGTLNGHRVWCRLASGQITLSQEQNAGTAQQDFTLQIKLNTDA